ncbi:uncharacterized protein K460DRAFT_405279 [Cucurbitaria berberidis CBS 394.84]|uniref:NADH dehydrogenase [ubiquinone] 1 alpha subcomplex subunit n=1 Tax=Cucurbitaria berberidis CBS 394.84 TaxID=1168544 RepID=A0A9P4L871_9PLEO|nr:uncharacterized protein K460DRAFT_405279 [Cucurbitaria berberidis CBS 394.84]KAF1844999.1 hypothetical protein K460DRAFT_405279 [Cucurbitaria berberidis CBS 394.84]
MAAGPSAIRKAWYQWKMMRLPWRKKWLVGFDLQGNTFWEFKDALHALRKRRIAKYSRKTHFGDVNVSPAWMQWLRHTRYDPPTVVEQQQDLLRQERMKILAAQADARWAAKPSALDGPDKQQPAQMLQSRVLDNGVTKPDPGQEIMARVEPPQNVYEEENTPPVPEQETVQIPHDSPEPTSTDDAPTLTTRKRMKKEPKDSPWKQASHGNSGQEWQPQGWSPTPTKRRT